MGGALHTVDEGAVTVDGDRVKPSDVGAYWLQGKLNEYYKDAVTSQKVADQVLAILKVRLLPLVSPSSMLIFLQLKRNMNSKYLTMVTKNIAG